jgi:hypothetical protein
MISDSDFDYEIDEDRLMLPNFMGEVLTPRSQVTQQPRKSDARFMLPDAQEVLYDSGEEDDIQLVQNMVDFDNMYVHNLRERAEQAGCQNRRNRRQLSKEQEQDLSTNLERMALPRQPVRNVTDLQPAEEEDESQEGRRKKREDVRLAWATNEVHQEDMSFQGSTLNYRGCEFTFPCTCFTSTCKPSWRRTSRFNKCISTCGKSCRHRTTPAAAASC